MGWWWNSSSHADGQTNMTSSLPAEAQPPSPSQNPPPSSNLKSIHDEDAAVREFLASIDWSGDANRQPKKTATQSQPEPPLSTSNATPTTSPSTPTSSEQTRTSSISPESLYPDEMSCRSAFDYAFFCQSFGGQWVNLYRYGELRSCSEHWENFWLCMRARGYSDESRRQTIRDHYRKKAIKYKTGPSSEDVWEVRLEPVKDPFKGDFAAFEEEMKKQRAAGFERS